MNNPSGVEPPSAPSHSPENGGPRESQNPSAPRFPGRRRILLVAGGGVAAAVLAGHGIGGLMPQIPVAASPDIANAAELPRPMEESPLPRDVHVSIVQARTPAAPPPALSPAQNAPASAPAAMAQPVPSEAVKAPAAPAPLATKLASPIPPLAPAQPATKLASPIPPVTPAQPATKLASPIPPVVPAQPATKLASPIPPVVPAQPATKLASPIPPVMPAKPKNTEAAWLRNARPLIDTGNVPAVAIIIDDLGLSARHTRQAVALGDGVTLAIMTYAPHPEEWVARARAARHEILVHVPMQPINARIDAGPNALTVSLSEPEILERLRWGLGRLEGYVGINNHMGSRFTQDRSGMHVVMEEVKSRGLLFLDSVTIAHTVGAATAMPLDVPFAERNVFLDDEPTVPYVTHQIAVLERFARKHGSAIAIGHPHPATLSVLAEWVPAAAARGIAVVPLTSVIRREASRA